MNNNRAVVAAVGMGAAAIALSACSSGSSSQSTVTVTATAPAPTEAVATAAVQPTKSVAPSATKDQLSGLPPAPGGSQLMQTSTDNGVQYARYATSAAPQQIVSYYSQKWQAEGYQIQSTGGGGGGWGKYGGSDAGANGSKGGSYVDVQAGGSTQGPTYFEVCQGPNKAAVNECGNDSKSGSS